MKPVNASGWPVGTELYVVPIRYWECDDLKTARVSENLTFEGDPIPDGNDPNFVYAFSDDYGHDVYLDRDMVFTDRDEAILYRDILRDHYKMESAYDFAPIWRSVLVHLREKRNGNA